MSRGGMARKPSLLILVRGLSSGLLVMVAVALASPAWAQQELLNSRWTRVETPNFRVISAVSDRQTRRFSAQLEAWRQVAAELIEAQSPLPVEPIPNLIYLFADSESLAHFTYADEQAFFYATPRSNFMALVPTEDGSLSVALHHYAHFLLRNYGDLSLPRWYEEGMAAYLSRIRVDDGSVEYSAYSRRDFEAMLPLSETLSMERLLLRNSALASPRLIQIANLKSESLLYYLRHGYLESDYPDRREDLEEYLRLLKAGRNARYALDFGLGQTSSELDAEFNRYLRDSAAPRISLDTPSFRTPAIEAGDRLEAGRVAVLLGELALNSGQPEVAESFFQASIDTGAPQARSFSGLGDALRFQDVEGRDQEIAALFERALRLSPNEMSTVLDFGEYWEAELVACDRSYPEPRRRQLLGEIKNAFEHALELAPDHPETNLAMGQYYLFPEADWRQGSSFNRKAFANLPADSFIMEQTVKYAILSGEYERAESLIAEMAQPLHTFGEPGYVSDLRLRLRALRDGEDYDECAE